MDAAESKLSLSDTTTKTIDGGIRALVRGNRSVSSNVTARWTPQERLRSM